jgi:hypothetical protein
VVDHCLYGVDKNPVAAEMAKLSLWLTTMARERPFTFLDHAIQVGDSLLGITDVDQLRWLHLNPSERLGQQGFESLAIDARLKEATELAKQLREMSVVTVRDAAEKQRLNRVLRSELAGLSVIADAVVGAALSTAGKPTASFQGLLDGQSDRIHAVAGGNYSEMEREAAIGALRGASIGWLRSELPDVTPTPWDRVCLHWPLAFPEVFLGGSRGRFDVVVANPPFLGGQRMSGAYGDAYRKHLVEHVAGDSRGSADLLAYVLRRVTVLAHCVGTLATNTVSQGDTRDVGLDQIADSDWSIFRAVKSEPWPNEATLEIAKLWLYEGPWNGPRFLDAGSGPQEVAHIDADLDSSGRSRLSPQSLNENHGAAFQGAIVLGMGFTIGTADAMELIESDPRNSEVLMPYLNARALNSSPTHEADRWVINFFDWSEQRAQQYPACYEIVENKVRLERANIKGSGSTARRRREYWWLHASDAKNLYLKLRGLERAAVIARVSNTLMPVFVPVDQLLTLDLIVFPTDEYAFLGVLSSSFHVWWAIERASTMRTDIRYSVTDVFNTFPRPSSPNESMMIVADVAQRLDEVRSDLMVESGLGLTKTYNFVNDPTNRDPRIEQLRRLHVDMDLAVRDAYGWSDLELDHEHWETPQGMRFTVSPATKDELLDRLLKLNHQRYAEEVAAGLHDKKLGKSAAKGRKKKSDSADQGSLL